MTVQAAGGALFLTLTAVWLYVLDTSQGPTVCGWKDAKTAVFLSVFVCQGERNFSSSSRSSGLRLKQTTVTYKSSFTPQNRFFSSSASFCFPLCFLSSPSRSPVSPPPPPAAPSSSSSSCCCCCCCRGSDFTSTCAETQIPDQFNLCSLPTSRGAVLQTPCPEKLVHSLNTR